MRTLEEICTFLLPLVETKRLFIDEVRYRFYEDTKDYKFSCRLIRENGYTQDIMLLRLFFDNRIAIKFDIDKSKEILEFLEINDYSEISFDSSTLLTHRPVNHFRINDNETKLD